MDSEKKVKHSALSDEAEADLLDPVAKLGVKLRKEVVDAAYPPIIQSGGVYDLKVRSPRAQGSRVQGSGYEWDRVYIPKVGGLKTYESGNTAQVSGCDVAEVLSSEPWVCPEWQGHVPGAPGALSDGWPPRPGKVIHLSERALRFEKHVGGVPFSSGTPSLSKPSLISLTTSECLSWPIPYIPAFSRSIQELAGTPHSHTN